MYNNYLILTLAVVISSTLSVNINSCPVSLDGNGNIKKPFFHEHSKK